MNALLSLLLGILVVLAITAATGYFVAQEFAYMAVDRSRLGARAEAGDAAAGKALTVTRRTSFMLSGAQLGITVTGLLVGYVAEPLIGEALGTMLGGVGVPEAVGIGVGTVLALLFSTVVQMVFGELFPKNLAIARAEPVALRLAGSTTAYLTVFGWLIKVFDAASNALLRAIRIEPVHDVEHSATVRDLEHIVAESREQGDLPAELSVLLDRILDFPGRTVEHAMIPHGRVDVVRAAESLEELRKRMQEGHSRYPVFGPDDALTGVVHLQDVLASETPGTVGDLQRTALLIPTTMRLPDALQTLTASRSQLACVLDEYGGFAGVLTVEDLAEELVGEITDEHDPANRTITTGDGESWVLPGDLHLDEAERLIGHDLPRGDYETLAGLVIQRFGALPATGTTVDVELPPDNAELAFTDDPAPKILTLEVLDIARHVPSSVRAVLR